MSVSETEGENNQTRDVFYNSLSLRLLLRKIHLPRQREAKSHLTIFYFHRLTFFEPRDYRVDFIYIKSTAVAVLFHFIFNSTMAVNPQAMPGI